MLKYCNIINEETKEVQIVEGKLIQVLKATQMDVEQAYSGAWYIKGYTPTKSEPTVQEQIETLENSITARNIRSAIQGDEFALNKISEAETQTEELRKLLPKGE